MNAIGFQRRKEKRWKLVVDWVEQAAHHANYKITHRFSAYIYIHAKMQGTTPQTPSAAQTPKKMINFNTPKPIPSHGGVSTSAPAPAPAYEPPVAANVPSASPPPTFQVPKIVAPAVMPTAVPTAVPMTGSSSLPPALPIRKRGRPKGSRNKKPEALEPSMSSLEAQQAAPPHPNRRPPPPKWDKSKYYFSQGTLKNFMKSFVQGDKFRKEATQDRDPEQDSSPTEAMARFMSRRLGTNLGRECPEVLVNMMMARARSRLAYAFINAREQRRSITINSNDIQVACALTKKRVIAL